MIDLTNIGIQGGGRADKRGYGEGGQKALKSAQVKYILAREGFSGMFGVYAMVCERMKSSCFEKTRDFRRMVESFQRVGNGAREKLWQRAGGTMRGQRGRRGSDKGRGASDKGEGLEKRYDMKPVFAGWPQFAGLREAPELFGEAGGGMVVGR